MKNISRHFSQVHGLESFSRKQWLILAKYQTMHTVYKHLSLLTREQTNHSSPVKRPCITMKTMQKWKRATKTRKVNEFLYSKILYPNFKFHNPMSILVVGPIDSGKTYFVDQLLSNLNEKMNFKNTNLKCRISWFYGQ